MSLPKHPNCCGHLASAKILLSSIKFLDRFRQSFVLALLPGNEELRANPVSVVFWLRPVSPLLSRNPLFRHAYAARKGQNTPSCWPGHRVDLDSPEE